jgi:hypothetical protein
MPTDRLLRKRATAGLESAATAEDPRERDAVHRDHPDQRDPHRSAGRPETAPDGVHEVAPRRSSVISATRSCVFAPRMAVRATRTASYPFPIPRATSDHAARRMRRARFRSTAVPTLRPATNATAPVPGARNTITRLPCNGRPSSSTRRTSRERTERRPRRSDGEPRAALASTGAEDRSAGARPHPMTEAVHLRAMTVVRLVRPLALGHWSGDPRSPAGSRRSPTGASIRAGHPRWPSPLTTERTSRPGAGRAVWKNRVLSSTPLSPRSARPGRAHPTGSLPPLGFPPLWKGSVE